MQLTEICGIQNQYGYSSNQWIDEPVKIKYSTVSRHFAVVGIGHMNTDLQQQLAKNNKLYGETKKWRSEVALWRYANIHCPILPSLLNGQLLPSALRIHCCNWRPCNVTICKLTQ
jgi:hypothetical protein